jgi:septal ring-binding cell division protein DamX
MKRLGKREVPFTLPLPLFIAAGFIVGLAATAALLHYPPTPPAPAPETKPQPAPIKPSGHQERVISLVLPPPAISEPVPAPVAEPAPPIPWQTAQWWVAQPANHFTLELATLPNLKELQSFVYKHHLTPEGELAWFTHQKEGQRWYTLVIGRYKDRRSAMKARLLLPDSIDPEQVEPRSFGSIRNASDPFAEQGAPLL